MSNPTYRTDQDVAAVETEALAALLAEVVEFTTRGLYPGRLADVAEAACQHESVQRQLDD